MAKITALLFLLLSVNLCQAQQGKDGAKTVTAINTIVNEYTALTVDAAAGSSFIKVSNSALNNNGRFTGPLAKGDLLMIIQLQGTTIKNAADSTWGAVTNYNNCGLYEFLEVTGVPDASTININCSIKNNYTAAGKVEIVRVPRFSSLTINGGGVLTADTWNGSIGGIVAVEVQNNTTINTNGSVDASGKGFRGGRVQNSASTTGALNFASTDADLGAEKGEGIAGYETDYNAYGGMFCRGAPANGGGGGDSHNAAGGGGANAGDINAWTGNGNPDITTNTAWVAAWNLDYAGFASSISSGGGRGGNTWCFNDGNAFADGPGSFVWGGDFRRNVGGKGGRPLDYSTGRLFLGGGGGAGQEDNSTGGAGGNGGGLIYILSYGTVGGAGNILSNGQNGIDANCSTGSGDPPGGGGAGGTVIINASGAVSGISISTNGGKGGSQVLSNPGTGPQPGESEGGGGGGGGGYIALSNGSVTSQATGAVNGTTNSSSLTEFIPDGATKGGNGLPNEKINPLAVSSLVVNAGPDKTICPGQSVALYGTGGDSTTTTYTWSPATGLSNTNTTHPVASPTITTTYTLTATSTSCPGKDSVVITVIPKVVIAPIANTNICPGNTASLNPDGSASYTYTWSPSQGLSCTGCPNPSANPSVSTTYSVIATNAYCSDTAQSIVVVLPLPTLTLKDTTICYGQTDTLYPVTNGTLIWSPANYLSCTACNNPLVTPLGNQTYTVTATLGICSVTGSVVITADRLFIFAKPDTTIYNSASVNLRAYGAIQFAWSPPNNLSSSTIANPVATPTATTTYAVTGYDEFGCSATTEVIIKVNDPCQLPAVPNAFSPNDDGKNDIFKLLNPYADQLVIFSIYNRWGQLVFETTDLAQGWDGKFNSQPEPVGSYVYYIKIICQGSPVSYKGNVTLLR